MTTREKVIVGFMVLTILYGAFELLGNQGASKKKVVKSTNPVQELKSFTASVTQKLFNEKVSKEYRYLISQAGNTWTKDPFIPSTVPLKKQKSLPSAPQKTSVKRSKPTYVYTGYLELGTTIFAVINGTEYAVGESIDSSELYIKTISAHMVEIAKVNGRGSIQVPITQIDTSLKNQTP